jgi:serine phosphatase RsbU (regulator of sigma subunit)
MALDDELLGTIKLDRKLLKRSEPAAIDHGHYLVLIAGARPGLRVEILQPVTVGRSQDLKLVFPDDPKLSRRHAQLSILNGAPVVEDLGSTNGTYVDGTLIKKVRQLTEGMLVTMGEQTFRYERRSRDDVRRAEQLDRDLLRASGYVTALLPQPLTTGAVRTDWLLVPCAKLGGDALGYFWLDERTFALFLIDVAGHGVGAAMHSVSVLNVLRQRALPDVDWHDPASVLATLNERFQMDRHDGMLLTAWYGVYDAATRTLAFSAAGHHAAYVVFPGSTEAGPLEVNALMIGALPGVSYPVRRVSIPADSVLYLFSDGVFEITSQAGVRWGIADFVPLLTAPRVGDQPEAQRLYQAVQNAAGSPLEDDFSVVVTTFP